MVDQLGFLRELAHKAGQIMRENRGKSYEVYQKADHTFVTEIDLAISRMVCEAVMHRYPEYGLLTEETSGKMLAPKRRGFIIDELDGTYAYLKGRTGFSFQCAYYNQFNDLRIGLIYDPMRDLLVYGIKNAGVWIEHKKDRRFIISPPYKAWEELRFAHHRKYKSKTLEKIYDQLRVSPFRIIPTGAIGSKVIDFVLGRVDALVALNKGIQAWDWAPGKVILEELGYHLGHLTGESLLLNQEINKSAFGYLVCPKYHFSHFQEELKWIVSRLQPNSSPIIPASQEAAISFQSF